MFTVISIVTKRLSDNDNRSYSNSSSKGSAAGNDSNNSNYINSSDNISMRELAESIVITYTANNFLNGNIESATIISTLNNAVTAGIFAAELSVNAVLSVLNVQV